MADWNRFSKKKFLENLYKGQNLKVRKFQIHSTLESKVIKRKPTGGAHCAPPSTNRVKPFNCSSPLLHGHNGANAIKQTICYK